ncbi:unnamed protein product [Meganyctiphanes norvegica]|uniref:NADPH-dependent FMN reductase-like domain-containing protein n=1 Tax=Meganyctiphanes norvegica TaxID=48144 RepID=A0AAV2QXL1_MEGNR
MSSLKVLVFLGSTREGRMGDKVIKPLMDKLRAASHDTELIDPLTIGGDGHIHQPMHFQRDQSKIPDWQKTTNDKIVAANAFVIVTPEYNCALPPALTSIMDQFPPQSYRHKPAAIVTYSMGSLGGCRAGAFARPFLSEFGMLPIPSSVCIPQIQEKLDGDGNLCDERVLKSIDKVVSEIAWYGSAILEKIKSDGVPN